MQTLDNKRRPALALSSFIFIMAFCLFAYANLADISENQSRHLYSISIFVFIFNSLFTAVIDKFTKGEKKI
jgi:ABC-type Fe3+ transport system permease subunit